MLNVMIVSAAWMITVIFLVSIISGFISKRVSNEAYGSIAVAEKKSSDVRPGAIVKAAVRAIPINKSAFKRNPKLRMPAVMRHIDMLC